MNGYYPNKRNNRMDTALHNVCSLSKPNTETTTKIVMFGANINAQNEHGETPIFTLIRSAKVQYCCSKPLIHLIQLGAKIDVLNIRSELPFDIAKRFNIISIM